MKTLLAIVALVVLAAPAMGQQTVWPWNQNRALLDPNWHCMNPKVVGRATSCFPLKGPRDLWAVTHKYSHFAGYSFWFPDLEKTKEYNPTENPLRSDGRAYHRVEFHVLLEFTTVYGEKDGRRLWVKATAFPWDARQGFDYYTDNEGDAVPYTYENHATNDPRVLLSVGSDAWAGESEGGHVPKYWMPSGAQFAWQKGHNRAFQPCVEWGYHDDYGRGCWIDELGPSAQDRTWLHNSMGIPLEALPVAVNRLRQCLRDQDTIAEFLQPYIDQWANPASAIDCNLDR